MDARLHVVALVTNIPGPLAAAALARDGAHVVKVEPLAGDPLVAASPQWYAELTQGLETLHCDLRDVGERERLASLLSQSDVLMTAMRPGALERLGLDWDNLRVKYPRLCHIAIVGEAAPHTDRAGHDLTFQAQAGLIDPPAMPRSVFADLFAAERAVAAAYRALYERERTGNGTRHEIAIASGALRLADPLRYGLTAPGGPLAGALPVYRLYQTADGWIALAALEPHFQARLREVLQLESLDTAALTARFAERSCAQWEALAGQFDLPLCAVANV